MSGPRGRGRWFREGAWGPWSWDTCAEFHRLERALWTTGIPVTLACVAAEVIVARTGCTKAEAWDRLAFNLERMCA